MRLHAIVALVFTVPELAAAQNAQAREGFGISFGVGRGSAGVECNSCSTDRLNGASGYLRLGGHVRPNLFVGFESNGWLHSDQGVDETVGYYSGVAQWYPNAATGFYVKGGVGITSYLADDGTDQATSGATALTLGIGYDFRVGRNFSLTPYANYLASAKGELLFNDVSTGFNWSINILQLGLGFTWH